MGFTFKDRTSPKNNIRTHVCGLTGHGKSYFAEEYCKQVGLNPIVIDIDDTNYSTPANPDISFLGSSNSVFIKICDLIDEITQSDEFNTIIYDGYDSSMEKITPKAKKHNPYYHLNIRKERCNVIMDKLLNSSKHLIFIGQLDSKISDDPENKPNYPIKKMNNCVNVSYYCYITKDGKFKYDIIKNRFGEQLKGLDVHAPIPYIIPQNTVKDNTIMPRCIKKAYDRLKHKGVPITRESINVHVNWNSLSDEDKELARQYIKEYCPEKEHEEL